MEKARTPLNVALSADGITCKAALILIDSTIGEYSYPSVIEGSDGNIHIVYTWRRKNIRYVKLAPTLLTTGKTLIEGQWPMEE